MQPSRGDYKLSVTSLFRALLIGFAIVGAFAAFSFDRINNERYREVQRASVADQAQIIRAKLEGNINANIQTVQGLVAAIRAEPELDQSRYEDFAEHLFAGKSQLRNIGAAPDMVIQLMYPLEGNEAAVGLDYRKNPAQKQAAEESRDTGELIVAGPVNLRQGGRAFIGRIPVFLPDTNEFWGLVSAVIDLDTFYRDSGLVNPRSRLKLALRGKDATGADGEVFFGEAEIFNQQPVLAKVALPSGSWQLAAVPAQGWPARADNALFIRVLLALGGVLIFVPALATLHLLKIQEQTARNLEFAKNQAEQAAKAKSEFLAVMSHEIRTPLNGVMGMLTMLKRGNLDDKQAHKVKIALSSADALLAVINDILDFSKVDAGKLQLESLKFDIAALYQEVIDMMMQKAQEKELQLSLDLSALQCVVARGDAARVRQILLNLLSNAIKFTERGLVRVSCTSKIEGAVVELVTVVEDTGIGIPPEKQKQLFQPFTQVDASTTRQYGGTGLGLAICKKLCELMGGDIEIQSSLGAGSRFSFRLNLQTCE